MVKYGRGSNLHNFLIDMEVRYDRYMTAKYGWDRESWIDKDQTDWLVDNDDISKLVYETFHKPEDGKLEAGKFDETKHFEFLRLLFYELCKRKDDRVFLLFLQSLLFTALEEAGMSHIHTLISGKRGHIELIKRISNHAILENQFNPGYTGRPKKAGESDYSISNTQLKAFAEALEKDPSICREVGMEDITQQSSKSLELALRRNRDREHYAKQSHDLAATEQAIPEPIIERGRSQDISSSRSRSPSPSLQRFREERPPYDPRNEGGRTKKRKKRSRKQKQRKTKRQTKKRKNKKRPRKTKKRYKN